MTPKEKAEKLFAKYYNRIEHTLSEEYSVHERYVVKECASMAIDEVLDHVEMVGDEAAISYWIQVKEELWKL